MSRKRNIFVTYGTLRVNVLEAVDLVDSHSGPKRVKVSKSSVFAVLKLISESSGDMGHYNSETHPFYMSENLVIGEEFLFDNASSTQTLVVAFYSLALEKDKNQASAAATQCCLGYTRIPLSRLEENVPITQWHQLLNSAGEGLRAAVKLECNFMNDSTQGHKNTSAILRRGGSTHNGSAYNNGAAGVSRNSMFFDEFVDEMVDDDDEDYGSEEVSEEEDQDFDPLYAAPPNKERVFVRLPNAPVAGSGGGAHLTTPAATGNGAALDSVEEGLELDHEHDDLGSGAEVLPSAGGTTAATISEDGSQVRLEAGIVDYCVMLGPAEPFSLLKPTHYITPSGALATLPVVASTARAGYGSSTAPSTTPSTPRTAPSSHPYLGLFSDSTSEEQEMVIWDRLPRHDHFDVEMPSKLEWFACPEGSKTVLWPSRPAPYFQSFVLSSGGETEEVYGLSVNFFVELGSFSGLGLGSTPSRVQTEDREDGDAVREEDAESDPAWWRRVRSIDPNPQQESYSYSATSPGDAVLPHSPGAGNEAKCADQKLWTVVSLCLLYRSAHHVQQLRKCLEFAYSESILENLRDWERQWEGLVRDRVKDGALPSPQLEGSADSSSPGAGTEPTTPASTELGTPRAKLCMLLSSTFQESFKPFSMHVEKLMAVLCLECPVPVPGFLSVRLQFPGRVATAPSREDPDYSSIGTPRCWKGASEPSLLRRVDDSTGTADTTGAAQRTVEFTAPSPEDFPRSPYPLEVLLKCFGPRALIDVVCCVLSECRILFHSSDLALLPVICEGLRALIYPLQWTHVYLPVVPMHLLSVVEAPVPFMLGTHSKWLRYIQVEYMNDMVLVDCDTASIDMGGSLALQFPEREDRWLMLALKALQQPVLPNHDIREITHPLLGRLFRDYLSDRQDEEPQVDTNTQIQLVFYDVLFHLLRYVPDCLFYLNPSCPVFNRPLFISDYASDEYRPALELITVTNCFHVLTESIHTPSLAFFYKGIVRLTEMERRILDQTIAAEEATKAASPGESPSLQSTASQLNLIAPSRAGKGGNLRRTNSGGGGGRAFTRNVSVANIIYDKLVSSGAPGASPQPTLGIQRQAGQVLNSTGGGDGIADDSAARVDSTPKAVQHTGRGLMRHISVLGISDGKEGVASRSFFGGVPAGFGAPVTETPNEAAYASLLPMWLLKPTHEIISTNPNRKVDSIRHLLNNRVYYYAPYLRHLGGDRGEARVLSPKSSWESLLALTRGHSDLPKPPAFVLTIACDYAVPVPSEAAAAAAALTLQQQLATPLSKSRPNLTRAGSAHNATRSGGSFSNSGTTQSFKGTPRTASKLALKSGSSELMLKTRSNLALSLPVLTTVPSFRAQSATVPAGPDSPLSRIFQSVKAESPRHSARKSSSASPPAVEEEGVEKETVGFEDSDSEEDIAEHDSGQKHCTFSSPGKSVRITLPFTPTTAPSEAAQERDSTSDADGEQPFATGLPAEEARAGGEDGGLHGEVPVTKDITRVEARQRASTPPVQVHDPSVALEVAREAETGEQGTEQGQQRKEQAAGDSALAAQEESEDSDRGVATALVEFDPALVVAAQGQVHRWTVADLAKKMGVPGASLLVTYSRMRSNAVSKLCENTQFAARHRAINAGAKQNAKLLNPADTQATFDKLSKMGSQQCDECITQFLQKVVTESILEEHWLEGSVQRCIKALQDRRNRRCLIDMLKNAKQNKDKRKAIANVYPLNSTAFEAFSKLFQGVLRICSNQEDFLCAYGLLEVGGLYFRLVSRDAEPTDGENIDQEDVMEFLSERTCQHPIYQNPALWCELLKSRVPLPSAGNAAAGGKTPRASVNAVLSEVHALLFIMLELEVNSSRALLFIQGVASDYGLGINDYYKLQRFVNRIWANNHVDEVAAQSQSDHDHAQAAALHRPEAARRKRSRENLRDRRTSMSIGDIVSMQGHNTSKIFRQGSVESIRGGIAGGGGTYSRTGSMRLRTNGDLADGSMKMSPRAQRRGSAGNVLSSDTAVGEELNLGTSSKHRRRTKSLHGAGASSLSIDIDSSLDAESHSGGFPAVPLKESPTPLPRQSLHQIVEHHGEGEDLSLHSHRSLQPSTQFRARADSHSVAPHTDSDEQMSSPGDHTDYSAPSSPRQESFRFGSDSASKDPSQALDEALGLQRVSSAMLMRTDSTRVSTARQNKSEPAKNLPNKFAPLELTGRDDAQVTAFDCSDSWLVTGTEDGSINITDLASGECATKFRHGSGSGDRYRGVTALRCLPLPTGGSAARAPLFFSGCSNGILKAWAIPATAAAHSPHTPNQSASSGSYWGIRMNLRLKQSLAVMKVHTAPVACLAAKAVVDAPGGWLLASGDEKGLVCLTRGSEKSSSTTCTSSIIGVNSARITPDGRPAPPVFSSTKAAISCLAFIGAPVSSSAVDAAAAGTKSKGAKKSAPPGATTGVASGAGGGVGAAGEEFLGVGTATGLISVLDLVTAQTVYQVVGHSGKVTQLVGLHSTEFISCSADRTIKLWDIRTRNRPTQTYPGKVLEERSFGAAGSKRCAASPITAIAVGGGDNSLVISTSADGVVRLWDRRYDVNVPCSVSHGHSSRITAIAWNGVGEFHTASHDGTVRTWDSINGQNTYTLQAFDEEGITDMKMASFRCAQHVTITPRGPVTFVDPDKPSLRTCLVTRGWNGTIRSFVYDVQQ